MEQHQEQHPAYQIPSFHKHYVGAAHSFEILNQDPVRPDVTILKTFFIDDTVNENDWQATWEGLKKDAQELQGIPLVLQEDLEHPKFSTQKFFDRGTIFDYDIDEANHKIIVYARITDPTIVERIKSGELEYVSPAVIPRGSEYMETIDGVDVLRRTLPLHLAIVGNPAYGTLKAKMTHLCTGDPTECYHRLKTMTASQKAKHRKKKTAQNGPGGDGDGDGGDGSPNSGIKSRLRILNASMLKMNSVILQMQTGAKFPKLHGKQGQWISAKGQDVFVAQNQSIQEALLSQCGCVKLGATGKISKEKANYHKTDSTEENCHTCRFYRAEDNYCEVVDGHIEPYMVSDLWQPKA